MSKRDCRMRPEIGFTNLSFGMEKMLLPLFVPAIILIIINLILPQHFLNDLKCIIYYSKYRLGTLEHSTAAENKMANPDIVIVDDDPMVGELSRDLLTDAGYTVTLVQDSLEAIPTIKAQMPRLIVTDIMMPGITGMDICKSVKSDPALRHMKIIVVSGKSYDVEKQRAFQFGADFFLQKPYNVETFSNTVKTILEGSAGPQAPAPPAPVGPEIIRDDEVAQASDLSAGQI